MQGVMDDTRDARGLTSESRSRHDRRVTWIASGLALICCFVWDADCRVTWAQSPSPTNQPWVPGKPIHEPDEPITEIRIEGNATIPADSILKLIKTRAGRIADATQIRGDIRSLYATRWFFSVEPIYRRGEDGLILVYRVLERPVLKNVVFKGNEKIKTKNLEALTGLRTGGAFSVSVNREAATRIEQHYHEKGFMFAKVELEVGDDPDDRDVVFAIHEGPKVHVTKIALDGNQFFSEPLLRTKLKTKTRKFWFFGGQYDPNSINDDIASLKEYYHGLGFFDVKINHEIKFSEDRSKVTMEYRIQEGVRYKVRNVEIAGNQVISEDKLRENLKLGVDDYFNGARMNRDLENIRDQYGEKGRIFAKVQAEPRYLEKPGEVDLVYNIDEDKVYRIRRVDVMINGDYPHTKESVVLNQLLFSPGDLANAKMIEKSRRRLSGSGYFSNNQFDGSAPKMDIRPVPEEELLADRNAHEVFRAQAGDEDFPPATNPVFNNDPQGDPFGNALRDPPPQFYGEPPGWIDIVPEVTETQTGRLMFGVGVNSDAGVVGSIVLDEGNFDILRLPTSFDDVLSGRAFRGAGQQFRLEAVPGNQVSRYLMSWRDPYFLDTNYSLGVSGFYYTRVFTDWYETRTGGRISLGRQFTPYWSGTVAFRLEDVEVTDVDTGVPTPPLLQEAIGHNFLSSVRLGLQHDTRDSSFLATEGHFIEGAFEQAYGDFVYSRFDLEGRQYFTVYQRADGEGRHIVSLRGQTTWTGDDTPIFERLYAGGFQSFRGFQFRGVTPRQNGIGVGGTFMALGSVEYMMPLTADEMLRAVAFSDFGTVEESTTLNNFRATAGAGLRITIPAMGPVPIALDVAWPITKQPEDDTRVFSFYVGFLR